MSSDKVQRYGSDLAWLWLWHRPAAVAPIRTLGCELPYDVGMALKPQAQKHKKKRERKKKKKKKKKKKAKKN